MDLKSNFRKFLFTPLLGILAFNALFLIGGILSCVVANPSPLMLIIYFCFLLVANICGFVAVLFVANKCITDEIIMSLKLFYDDLNRFYEHNKNGLTEWSQRVITSPKEVVEVANYFHNNIAMQLHDLNVRLNEDSLTGLRTSIRLRSDIEENPNHVIAVLNISNFKEINSFYGVKTADGILCSVASMLKSYFANENYLLYRIHGDDFAVLWPNCTDRSMFVLKLEKFLEFLGKKEILVDGYTYLNLSATIGISFSYDSTKYSMVNALMALHHAKEYKNPIVIYNKNLPILTTLKNNILYTEVIYQAIKNDGVVPFFQKLDYIQNEKNDGMTKYEALIRIIDEGGHIIAPGLFLEISKRSNAYSKLSRIMIDKSLKFLSTRENCVFSVNLALEDMNSDDFSSWFLNRIVHYNLEGRVVIEITEQESVEDFDSVSSFISSVKELGVKVALDDFGSGYSNFALLMKLQIDYLKIDGSLIKNIDKDKNAQIIVETIVRFAKMLKIATIAEFVSSEEIYNVVKSMGIDYAQGYYVGKPMEDI